MRNSRSLATAAIASLALLASTSFGQYRGVAKFREHERDLHEHLRRLNTLDFGILTQQNWEKLSESHAKNIVVHWPDGRRTAGLQRHLEDLKVMFVHAPDMRVQAHPVKFGSADWTCVIGVMEGTFTKPLRTRDGKAIPPSGKRFKINMCSVGHWNKAGLMDEEYLFWDNQSYMRQLGITR